MANFKLKIKNKILKMKANEGVARRIKCTEDEKKVYNEMVSKGQDLPEGIIWETGDYFLILDDSFELSEKELTEYFTYKKLKLLRTIKNSVVFFVTLTILSLILGFLIVINT